jgi:hypothetical protein
MLRGPIARDFALNPTSPLLSTHADDFATALLQIAVGHVGQLGCLVLFLGLRLYALAGGRFFINREQAAREEARDRALGNWTPRNEIERMQEELRREALQGDEITVRPRKANGELMTNEEILSGMAGSKAAGDARVVFERKAREAAKKSAEEKKDE